MKPKSVDASYLTSIAHETINICDSGVYKPESGESVNISSSIKHSKSMTVEFPPEKDVFEIQSLSIWQSINKFETRFVIEEKSTLNAAKSYSRENVCALNFASAKKPGGRFLQGSPAQEESICRCSALYPCIKESEMYSRYKEGGDGSYSDYAIYSPDVPVFRNDNYDFLEEPFFCSFLTCAAPNYNENCFSSTDHTKTMKNRINRILRIMANKVNDHIILGAWGCGSFGHNPQTVAELFHELLTTSYKGVFDLVVFAILDYSNDKNCIKSFQKTFKSLI